MMLNETWIAVILCLVALGVTTLIFPPVLRFAKEHKLVDNPNYRKLQRVPVPVIGGTAVFFGFAVALSLAIAVFHLRYMGVGLVATGLMWMLGTWDDLKDIPANLRFIIEVFVLWGLITLGQTSINDFHGLWGVHAVSPYISIPLSILTGVGLLNAINMIDGVDGYCSGFGMVSSLLFAVLFFAAGDVPAGCFALICAGALLPFFLHNVFGKRTKMFIGDGGSLMIGMLMTLFVYRVMVSGSLCDRFYVEQGMGLAAFTLAVLCIPVADTLRVMSARILKGKSPFSPDKTHLHHLFIEMGFTHVATSLSILLMDLVIVAVWFLSWKLGASVDVQLYVVILMGLLVCFGFYFYMESQRAKNTALWQGFCKLGALTRSKGARFRVRMRRLVDGPRR